MAETYNASIRTWNTARLLCAACLLMVGLAAPAPAEATTYTWIGPFGGDWNDNLHWSPSTGFPNSRERHRHRERRREPLAIGVPSSIRPVLQRLQINGSTGLI